MTVGDVPFTESADPSQADVNPVDVRVIEDITETERRAPDFGSANTFTLQLAGAAQPVQVLQRRLKRSKARVIVPAIATTSFATSLQSSPAPGANFIYTNTSGVPQNLVSLGAQFVADATVGNRFLTLTIKDGSGNTLVVMQDGAAVVASASIHINAFQGATQANSSSGQTTFPLPQNFQLLPGYTVTLSGIVGPADQFGQINLGISQASGATAAIFHNNPNPLANPTPPPGVGVQVITAPFTFDWESQQPLYGVGVGGPVQVSVIDETYE
jgi:hypothetical protein